MFRFMCLMVVIVLLTPIESHESKLYLRIRQKHVNCQDKVYKSSGGIIRDYWVLENYIMADHGPLPCYANVTYTTHADYRYLDNVVPLLERWRSPLSLAIYAPGEDFDPSLRSILYLLQCHPGRHLVRELTSFHLYFDVRLMPKMVPRAKVALSRRVNCSAPAPYANVRKEDLYRSRIKVNYPVNTGRNIARDASLTHLVLASDIELYPSTGLVKQYLHLYSRILFRAGMSEPELLYTSPVVHVLRVFEVLPNVSIPNTKEQLQNLIYLKMAAPFHLQVCEECHRGPDLEDWISDRVTNENLLSVFVEAKRLNPYELWEPIFIGNIRDPPYDERLTWEGQRDKMTQAYAMCVLNYSFNILDNAFLVHKPGIKKFKMNKLQVAQANRTNKLLNKKISRDLEMKYGSRKGCVLL